MERNVIDTDEEQKNKNGFNKKKITNKSKYVIQHNESEEEEEEKEKKSNNNNNNKKAATFQKKSKSKSPTSSKYPKSPNDNKSRRVHSPFSKRRRNKLEVFEESLSILIRDLRIAKLELEDNLQQALSNHSEALRKHEIEHYEASLRIRVQQENDVCILFFLIRR